MKYFSLILLLILILIPVNKSFASTDGVIRLQIFNNTLKTESAIGWNHPNHLYGGRSWEAKDLYLFNNWLSSIVKNKNEYYILKRWGIAHDCFDSIMALHFIYAYKNGLALKYNRHISSKTHAKNPAKFLTEAFKKYGTINSHRITYEVDLWETNNFSPGLIYVYPGSPGHAYIIGNRDEAFYFYKIESSFPASFSKLKVALFTENNRISLDPRMPATFRRFPLYINNGQRIRVKIPDEFPQVSTVAKKDWWSCVGDDAFSKRPLWENIRNFLNFHQENNEYSIIFRGEYKNNCCQHNLYWKKKHVVNPPPAPDYLKAIDMFQDELCALLKERIKKVNVGYKNCHEALNVDETKCTADASGDYSTPSFDKRIKIMATLIEDLVKNYGISPVSTDKQGTGKCGSFNIYEGTFHSPLYIKFPMFNWINEDTLRIKDWLYKISDSADKEISDPKAFLPQRWGCEPADSKFTCLDVEYINNKSIMENIAVNDLSKRFEYQCFLKYDAGGNNPKLVFKADLYGSVKKSVAGVTLYFSELNKQKTFDFQNGKLAVEINISKRMKGEVIIEFFDNYGDVVKTSMTYL